MPSKKVNKPSRNSFIKSFEPIVDCIADLFGRNCEVVLHDVTDLEHSIVKIRNGHVTGRKTGDMMTDLGLKQIKESENGRLLLGNYNPTTKTGKKLKANSATILDPKGNVIGTLCINLDVTELVELEKGISSFYKAEKDKNHLEEKYDEDITSIVRGIISDTVKDNGKPIHNLKKEDRMAIIERLDNKGLFIIKGAVLTVSKEIGISIPSIYKYLEEIRFQSKHNRIT